jgi:hypothetical protein
MPNRWFHNEMRSIPSRRPTRSQNRCRWSAGSNILRQMAQWDSFIDVLNQLNEIIRLENQVEQGTNQLKRSQTERVFDP